MFKKGREIKSTRINLYLQKPETNKNGAGGEQVQRTGMGGSEHTFVIQPSLLNHKNVYILKNTLHKLKPSLNIKNFMQINQIIKPVT